MLCGHVDDAVGQRVLQSLQLWFVIVFNFQSSG